MIKYILVREHETIEVLEGREERRDKLIAAGYEWVNKPIVAPIGLPDKIVKPLVDKVKDTKEG